MDTRLLASIDNCIRVFGNIIDLQKRYQPLEKSMKINQTILLGTFQLGY